MADTVSLPAVVRQEPGGQSGVEVRRRSRAPSQAGVPELRCPMKRVLGLMWTWLASRSWQPPASDWPGRTGVIGGLPAAAGGAPSAPL